MPYVIPVFPDTPLYKERVRLEGRDFVLYFDWNDREKRWYISFNDQDDEPILVGIKIIVDWPLLSTYKYNPDLPPGEFLAYDFSQTGEPPTLFDFGDRVKLYYYPTGELIDKGLVLEE